MKNILRETNLKDKKAITLIALIITIIVLLVLAGVSITMLSGDNSTLTRASTAKTTSDQEKAKEELQLAITGISVGYHSDASKVATGDFRNYIFSTTGQNEINAELGENATYDKKNYKIIYKNYTFDVTFDGKIAIGTPVEPLVATREDFFIFDEETGTITGIVQDTSADHSGIGWYYIQNDGSYCSETNIVIPETINGVKVSKINGNALCGKWWSDGGGSMHWEYIGFKNIENVVFPDDITIVGELKLNWSEKLKSINIPSSVTSIGNYAFQGCKSLTEITIPNGVTSIGESAFQYCSSLTEIRIPDNITSIRDFAFFGCSNLLEITIPNGITRIGRNTFSLCRSLTEITIPNGVTSIGELAFSKCSSLIEIEIPNSVTSIASSSFSDCSSLRSIKVDENNTIYDSRNNCNAVIQTSQNLLLLGCQNTIIPNSITSIGSLAFSGCDKLVNITIPDNIISIGNNAFTDCSNLTSIEIPASVTNIGSGVFARCSRLMSIVVDENNLIYDSRDNCNAIIDKNSNTLLFGCKNTTIPNSITKIGDSSFSNCNSLTNLAIPNSVTSIGYNAFSNCIDLSDIKIPNSINAIDHNAFQGCTNLFNVTIDSQTIISTYSTYYAENGFIKDYLLDYAQNVYIKNDITTIGSYVTTNFTKQATSDKEGYDLYIRNS